MVSYIIGFHIHNLCKVKCNFFHGKSMLVLVLKKKGAAEYIVLFDYMALVMELHLIIHF